MVKGTARRVIVVKSPDPKIFEQAIFVVREDYLHKQGVSRKQLLRQAKRAADGYVGEACGGGGVGVIPVILGFMLGVIITVIAWYMI